MTVAEAYRVCRAIARREARNFYFSFVALPRARRNAICAVYAFMRQADDLSDDESVSRQARRERMAAWIAAWRDAAESGKTDDPVFIALNDARVRFRIPLALLDQLVEGTALDLEQEHDERQSFATFDELRRYCYLVASVVGLVCIRHLRLPVERGGKAGGGARHCAPAHKYPARRARGCRTRARVPAVDELAVYGFTPESLSTAACSSAPPSPAMRAMLAAQAARAEAFYRSGARLLPLIDAESRPALWVLMTIYHRLLQRIERAGFDVFSSRISVPTGEKLALLVRGLGRTALARVELSLTALAHGQARRVRRPARPALSNPENSAKKVAVVGAGVAGLAAGLRVV